MPQAMPILASSHEGKKRRGYEAALSPRSSPPIGLPMSAQERLPPIRSVRCAHPLSRTCMLTLRNSFWLIYHLRANGLCRSFVRLGGRIQPVLDAPFPLASHHRQPLGGSPSIRTVKDPRESQAAHAQRKIGAPFGLVTMSHRITNCPSTPVLRPVVRVTLRHH